MKTEVNTALSIFWNNLLDKCKVKNNVEKSTIDINDKSVKFFIREYIKENLPNSLYLLEIHAIITKTSDDVINIEIILGSPGLIIGKAGRTIEDLTAKLKAFLSKEVKIKLTEYSVWR